MRERQNFVDLETGVTDVAHATECIKRLQKHLMETENMTLKSAQIVCAAMSIKLNACLQYLTLVDDDENRVIQKMLDTGAEEDVFGDLSDVPLQ